jgi:adenosylcobyric acid synthase
MPAVEMNPILIKPHSDITSQVVLVGKVWGQVTASDYHTRVVEELFPVVLESYRKLASEYDLILFCLKAPDLRLKLTCGIMTS